MKLIFLELNEINFDAVNHYIRNGVFLPGFKKIIDRGVVITESETEYEKLEPWIQWPSVHTGKCASEHEVFRLGDFVNSKQQQIFEKIENAGYSVGAISPMNASNKLQRPAYFIPDPWTQTSSDGSFLSKAVATAVSQAVNDNSQSKLTVLSIMKLPIAFLMLVNPARFLPMFLYALSSFHRPWRRALFLDMLLYEIHKTLFRRKKPDFSTLFLNAGAHIQHHYFYNSLFVTSSKMENPGWYINASKDPFLEMLEVYDTFLQDLEKISNTEVIIATGLSQKPYDQLKFYYRLKDHKKFLNDIGISFSSVFPRMTRDFLITFDSIDQCSVAAERLRQILVSTGNSFVNETRLFEEIDNRGKELFVVLTYPDEIFDTTTISLGDWSSSLAKYVTFVAIKNGEHQSKGFACFSNGIRRYAPKDDDHVLELHNTILSYFGVPN